MAKIKIYPKVSISHSTRDLFYIYKAKILALDNLIKRSNLAPATISFIDTNIYLSKTTKIINLLY